MSDFDFDLSTLQGSCGGLDAFFNEDPAIVTPLSKAASLLTSPKVTPRPPKVRRKVATLEDLNGFIRTAEYQLINKSTQDFWSLKKEGEDYYIERLFDDQVPLKG